MPTLSSCRFALAAIAFVLITPDASALLLYAEGEAGNFGSQERQAGPSSVGPLLLPSLPTGSGGRLADFTAHVAPGDVRLTATASAAAGAQSVGNWDASVEGFWEDTITFDIDTDIPGVVVVPGVTPVEADLVVLVTGLVNLMADNTTARVNYSATLGYGTLNPFEDRGGIVGVWDDQRGQAQESGELDFSGGWDGEPLPVAVTLPITFVAGETFDVRFRLQTRAELGWEGLAPSDLLAQSLLDQTAVWQAPQNVTVFVDDGVGGTIPVGVPGGAFSLASELFDYTDTTSVPEPGVALLAGLGVLALRRSGRRG